MMRKMGWLARAAALMAGVAATASAHAGSGLSYAGAKWNLPEGVTDISHEVYDLHMRMFWTCVWIGIGVFGVMIWSLFAHRRSVHPQPASFHESTTVEIIWTVIPFIILIVLAVPAAATLIKMENSSDSALTIRITGYQWKWQYQYVGTNVSFFSTLAADSNHARQLHSGIDPNTVPNYLVDVDHPLVIPTGEKVRFAITGNDVIHAWWVPDFAVKKDAIPGYINEAWAIVNTPGTYRGVCAELCGRDHGFMPIVVKAVPRAEFNNWLKQQEAVSGGTEVASTAPVATPAPAAAAPAQPEAKPAAASGGDAKLGKDELMAAGAKVYATNCQACHQANGQGLAPTFPALKGSKIAAGPVDAHIKQVLNGKNVMPPFRQLSDADIAAVVTYERNSWGNDAGIAEPAQVAALRK